MGTNVVRIVVYRVLCTSQENSRPKTFRKNAKKAENAKKTYFYKVKKRKITHADAEKRRKMSRIHLFQFFVFFRICMCDFSLFYLIKTIFFEFFAFFAFFLKVFGQDFSWAVHRTQYQEKSWPKTFRKKAKKTKNANKPYFYKVKRRKITHADAKKCEKWEQMLLVLLCIVFCAHPRKIPGRKLLGKRRKKTKNAKKKPYFYKVKRRKITHADAEKGEK